ncbi:hypothetical protein NDU88_001687 [Pleurodeles waltl]|uniref:Uncharacterized protein n=1 Tax=Pleurodeles waltl TaxID=8319 RepID=A0AAV7VYC2_PLEWA|nr:hypothetical protein NDU88_001687 [Pleurodeles waltl]
MGYEVIALALYTVAVGGRRPRRNPALFNIRPYGSQEPMTMYAGSDGTHRHGRDRHFLSVPSLDTLSSTGEDLHCKCCCDLSLEETMACQRPPEEGHLACHRQGSLDPGGLTQTEHPLPEKMGGHSPLEQEDGGGPAGDVLPKWEGCLSHHDPPDAQDPGGGVSEVGWALEGITAATRG